MSLPLVLNVHPKAGIATWLLNFFFFSFNTYLVEMGKDICVNVTCLGSCNFLLSKAT